MNILTIITILILLAIAFLGYIIYKNRDTCGFDPFCYFNNTKDLISSCGIKPWCYTDKLNNK